MKADGYRKFLKAYGFTEYSLRKFRESQRKYSRDYENIAKKNKEILGNATTTQPYDYKKLFDYLEATGEVGVTAVKELEKYQREEMEMLDKYNITMEIYENLREGVIILKEYDVNARVVGALEHFDSVKYNEIMDTITEIKRYEQILDQAYNTELVEYKLYEHVSHLKALYNVF